MLRLVVIALLIANGAYYAWSHGLLAGMGLAPVQQQEPERMNAQVDPGTVRLLNGPLDDKAAPAVAPSDDDKPGPLTPSAADTVQASCWQATGFTAPQAENLRAALGQSGLEPQLWQLSETRTNGRWVVYMGRYGPEQMEKKKGELRDLKIEFREVNLPTAGPGLALGTFSSEEAVQQGLKDVTKKGVRSARVAMERPEGVSVTLRLPAITDEQRGTVEALGDALAGKQLQPCE